jgi:hypothetical protein
MIGQCYGIAGRMELGQLDTWRTAQLSVCETDSVFCETWEECHVEDLEMGTDNRAQRHVRGRQQKTLHCFRASFGFLLFVSGHGNEMVKSFDRTEHLRGYVYCLSLPKPFTVQGHDEWSNPTYYSGLRCNQP